MTTTKEDGKLIKVDAIGRVRTSASQREALLDAYESSGLSGPEFSVRHGVKYQTFATWLQKRKRRTGGYPAMSAADGGKVFPLLLAEVECPDGAPATSTPLEVRLPGGATLAIHCYGPSFHRTSLPNCDRRISGGFPRSDRTFEPLAS